MVANTCTNIRGQQEEQILIERARGGDEDAYSELVRRSWDVCVRLAICALGRREDALDEVQDAFCRAYINLGAFHQDCKFSTWVGRIVINLCLTRRREHSRIRLVSTEAINSSGEDYTAYEPIESTNPEERLGEQEVKTLVRCELQRIPILLRVPLELRYVQGLQIEAVAHHLNLTVAAAKSRLHRARRILRDRMFKHCGVRGFGTLARTA